MPIIIVKKTNSGLSSARNTGIQKSTAALLAFLDADDTWYPTKLEQQLKVFKQSSLPSLGLVYCDYDLITITGTADTKSYKVPLDYTVRGNAFKKILRGNKVLSSGSGVMIKKEVFATVGLFDETLRYGEDWDMWLRIAEHYDIDFVDEVLVHIRRHTQNMTANSTTVFAGEIAFYKKWLPLLKTKQLSVPLKWRIKVLYRIIIHLPKTDFIKDALPILFVPFR